MSSDRLFKAAGRFAGIKAAEPLFELRFLEVLRGCGEAEVKYRRDVWDNTVLMELAQWHDWPMAVAALIERGCDVNTTNGHGQTALHCAGRENRRETARVLLERGADRTITNERGETAADRARNHGKTDLAAYIDTFDPTARLYDATDPGRTEANFLEVLPWCGEDEVKYRDEHEQNTVLTMMALDHDWPKAAMALIGRGCDVNARSKDGTTALIAAAFTNRRQTARALLEHGADRTIKDKWGTTAAVVARSNGHAELASYIDGFGSAVRLFEAAWRRKTEAEFLEVLRGCGEAEVKYRDGDGWTVLMMMARRNEWPEAAAAVIERGCEVNAQNKYRSTALHYASERGYRETVRVLLERGADRTIKSRYGATAANHARWKRKNALAAYIDGFTVSEPSAEGPSAAPPPPATAAASDVIDLDELEDVPLAAPAPPSEAELRRRERHRQRELKVKLEREARDEAKVEEAAKRVRVKEEQKEQAAARAADPDSVAMAECVNLEPDAMAPPPFEETEEVKACPSCRRRVTIPVDKVYCGWTSCLQCGTEFCWRCKAVAVGPKRRCRSCK